MNTIMFFAVHSTQRVLYSAYRIIFEGLKFVFLQIWRNNPIQDPVLFRLTDESD